MADLLNISGEPGNQVHRVAIELRYSFPLSPRPQSVAVAGGFGPWRSPGVAYAGVGGRGRSASFRFYGLVIRANPTVRIPPNKKHYSSLFG